LKIDEFVEPFSVKIDGEAKTVKDNDSVVFFNFRPDRARELTRVFCVDDFDGFDRGKRLHTTFVCFTDYDDTIKNKLVAFEKEEIKDTFGEFLASKGLKQLRLAETEKSSSMVERKSQMRERIEFLSTLQRMCQPMT